MHRGILTILLPWGSHVSSTYGEFFFSGTNVIKITVRHVADYR